jgi:hypothetical protein
MLRGNGLGGRLSQRHRFTSLAMAATCVSISEDEEKSTILERRRSGLTLACVLFTWAVMEGL